MSALDTFVYFTECVDTIKIGYSREPQNRAKTLRGTLLVATPGDRRLETLLHKRFRHLQAERIPRPGHADTEHFHKDPELLDFVGRVAAGEQPEDILAAEERAEYDRRYADLVQRCGGDPLWLQAQAVRSYTSANYGGDENSIGQWHRDQLDAIRQIGEVEQAWECLAAGACHCRCHLRTARER